MKLQMSSMLHTISVFLFILLAGCGGGNSRPTSDTIIGSTTLVDVAVPLGVALPRYFMKETKMAMPDKRMATTATRPSICV